MILKNYISALSVFAMLTISVQAQVTHHGEITKVQSGHYKFAKGAVQVTFADTVSETYVKEQMKLLGYEFIELTVHPITARTDPDPPHEVLNRLSKHPYIDRIEEKQRNFPEKSFQEMIERRNSSEEEEKELRKSFEKMFENRLPDIIFKQYITEEMAKSILGDFTEIGLELKMIIPKTAIIKTRIGEEGKELESP